MCCCCDGKGNDQVQRKTIVNRSSNSLFKPAGRVANAVAVVGRVVVVLLPLALNCMCVCVRCIFFGIFGHYLIFVN